MGSGTHEADFDWEAFKQSADAEWLAEYKRYEPKRGEKTGMNINEVYQSESNYLKAEDLQGKTVGVTIESWELGEFDQDGKKSKKLVLSFAGKAKKLALNVTNARTIAHNVGSEDANDWIGKRIEIYPTKTDFGGKQVDCIRIKEMAPPTSDADF